MIEFVEILPENDSKQILISGDDSLNFANSTFLQVQEDTDILFYEIKFENHYGPFQEALLVNNFLAVGVQNHFYLFDRKSNKLLIKKALDGYFGHLYFDDEHFFVADATGIYCIDQTGTILWHTTELGVDGIVIHDFKGDKITGNGDFDPPGGWEEFVLNKKTGVKLS